MNNFVSLSESEKKAVSDASDAADGLMNIWYLFRRDRVKEEDLVAAQKHTETLVEFGKLIQRKLSPKTVQSPNPSEKSANADATYTDSPVKKLLRCKVLRCFFQRFF